MRQMFVRRERLREGSLLQAELCYVWCVDRSSVAESAVNQSAVFRQKSMASEELPKKKDGRGRPRKDRTLEPANKSAAVTPVSSAVVWTRCFFRAILSLMFVKTIIVSASWRGMSSICCEKCTLWKILKLAVYNSQLMFSVVLYNVWQLLVSRSKSVAAHEYFLQQVQCLWNNFDGWNNDVVTCEIKHWNTFEIIWRNNFEIISVYYFENILFHMQPRFNSHLPLFSC